MSSDGSSHVGKSNGHESGSRGKKGRSSGRRWHFKSVNGGFRLWCSSLHACREDLDPGELLGGLVNVEVVARWVCSSCRNNELVGSSTWRVDPLKFPAASVVSPSLPCKLPLGDQSSWDGDASVWTFLPGEVAWIPLLVFEEWVIDLDFIEVSILGEGPLQAVISEVVVSSVSAEYVILGRISLRLLVSDPALSGRCSSVVRRGRPGVGVVRVVGHNNHICFEGRRKSWRSGCILGWGGTKGG